MKKYIREMIDDLRKKNTVIDLNPPPEPAMPDDLNNQILSKNPAEKVKQLDFQAQENEERETS
jgi:hypothetical protein